MGMNQLQCLADRKTKLIESDSCALVARFRRLETELFLVFPDIDLLEIKERIERFSLLSGFTYSGHLYTIPEFNSGFVID